MNTGCIPTKTLVASAYVAYKARTAAFYGVNISGPVTVDIKAVKARKDEIVGKSRLGVEDWLQSMQNCTVYEGHARFESARSIRVGDEIFSAEEIFINAGGRAVIAGRLASSSFCAAQRRCARVMDFIVSYTRCSDSARTSLLRPSEEIASSS